MEENRKDEAAAVARSNAAMEKKLEILIKEALSKQDGESQFEGEFDVGLSGREDESSPEGRKKKKGRNRRGSKY